MTDQSFHSDSHPYRTLRVELDQRGVLFVSLNRPEVRNAFNEEVMDDLAHAFGVQALDSQVGVVVLRGEGPSFCAGGDLNWMKKAVDFSYEENLRDTRKLAKMFATLNECPKPVIGLIHGAAIGGGVGLVSVCDIAIASAETVFSLSEVRLGIVPACIGPFVVAKIGASHARGLFMSAERFQAQKAKEIGLVHEVVSTPQDINLALDRVLPNILQCGPNAMAVAKRLVLDLTWPEHRAQMPDCLEYVAKTLSDLRISEEGQEGVRAFLETKTSLVQSMKTKLLVANRSEIACRIFQACREMGLKTVGLLAPGDEDARHLTYADEVYSVASYLDIQSILEVAQRSGAQLVHPGYGFLSERSAFARAVEKAGLIFVGPRPETMELMGGKIAAKELASRENVPTLPWAKVPQGGDLASAAQKVGFPLLLKASAGGGGKGMRRVERVQDLADAAESASAEALAAFGDGTLFLERLVDHPRHIEVQVFGNGQGEGVHLFERECSLQRRHQKIWEEAPAPHLSEKTRQGLFAAALKLVRATQYRNAGTIEFLVDSQGEFYFLEMNTRLQVEHPVTESVTGIDLVCAQIQLARFPNESVFHQAPTIRGHSIEVRLYAEDPAQGFIPTPGRVEKLRWPTGAGIRIESGIEEGQTVGTQFDSMLAKLIVSAQSRDQALERLKFALEETVILGIGTNQSYLRHLAEHPRVKEGKVNTGFLSSEFGEFGSFTPTLTDEDLSLLLAAKQSMLGQVGVERADRSGAERIQFPSPWVAFSQKGVRGE